MNEIARCPFPDCESEQTFAEWDDEAGVWLVRCRACGATGPRSEENDGGDDAVARWNDLGDLLSRKAEADHGGSV